MTDATVPARPEDINELKRIAARYFPESPDRYLRAIDVANLAYQLGRCAMRETLETPPSAEDMWHRTTQPIARPPDAAKEGR